MGERVLGEVEQHVGLVLVIVDAALELIASGFGVEAATSVMACCDVVERKLPAALLKRIELEVAVAVNAGFGVSPVR